MKRILKLFFVFLFLIIFSNIFKEKVFALTTDPSKLGIVTNGTIYDIVTDGNQAYISGTFSKVGPSIGAMGLFNLNTFSLTRPDKVYGDINVIISDGSDGWYIGGSFTKVGNHTTKRVAHINNNGTVDTNFTANVSNKSVYSLLLYNGKLYIGGNFTSINGVADNRIYIAALSSTDGTLDAWYPGGQQNYVNEIGVYDGNIYWYVSSFYRIYRASVATGTKDNGWLIELNSGVYDWYITEDGYIYLAGAGFTTINSVACSSRFTKVKISDYSIDPLNLALNGTVRKIYFSGDTLYLAGDFTSILGSTRNRFAKVNTLTTVPTLDDLDVNANDSIYDFNISVTNLYLGGKFTTVSATSRIGFASYDLTNLQLNAWNPGVLNGYINDIYVYGTQIVLGGDFTSMDVVTRYGLASYNTSTGVISAWAPYTDTYLNYALYIEQDASNIYLVGRFKSVNGTARCNIASVSKASGELQALNKKLSNNSTCPSYDDARVRTAYVDNGILYVGGDFDYVDGVSQKYFAAYNLSDFSKVDFNPAANDIIISIKVYDDKLYLGGLFTNIGGQARNALASYDLSDYSLTSFNPVFNSGSFVKDIEVTDDKIFASGSFSTVNSFACDRFAAFNKVDYSHDTDWCFTFAGVYATVVYDMTIVGDDIYITGSFDTVAGSTRYNLASFNLTTHTLNTWAPNADTAIAGQVFNYTIDSTSSAILTGGTFDVMHSTPANYYAQFDIPSISFNRSSYTSSETNTSYNIVLDSSFAPVENITVEYYVSGGTATVTNDYVLADGTATITAGSTSTNIALTIIDDEDLEETETIIVTLRNPVNSILGSTTSFTYSIEDNDQESTFFYLTNVPATGQVETALSSNVTLTVKDQLGNVKTDYLGEVQITSNDLSAALPGTYTFTEEDEGIHNFSGSSFSFPTVGNKTITFTDGSDPTITVTSDNILIKPETISDFACTLYTSRIIKLTWTVPKGISNGYVGQYRKNSSAVWNNPGNVEFGTAWSNGDIGAANTQYLEDLDSYTLYSFILRSQGSNDIESSDSNIINCTTAGGSYNAPPVYTYATTTTTTTTTTLLTTTTTVTTTTLPSVTTTIPTTTTTLPNDENDENEELDENDNNQNQDDQQGSSIVIPQPPKPINQMNTSEKRSYILELQHFVIILITKLITLIKR